VVRVLAITQKRAYSLSFRPLGVVERRSA